jgi:sporulation protein YpjB
MCFKMIRVKPGVGIITVIFIFSLLLWTLPSVIFAETEAKPLTNHEMLELVNKLATDIYEATNREDYITARKSLEELSKWVMQIDYSEVTSVEGMGAFVDSVNEGREIFVAVRFDPQKALLSIAKIRFAADALIHPNQPLWLNYYSVLKEDITQLQDAKNRKHVNDAKEYTKRLKMHYELIRPAVLISRPVEMVDKMDSILKFIQKQVSSELTLQNNANSGIDHLKFALDELFFKDKTTLGPLYAVSTPLSILMGIASIIVSVLSFVAWKKFNGARRPI